MKTKFCILLRFQSVSERDISVKGADWHVKNRMTSLHCTLFFALLTVYRQLDRQTDRQTDRHTVLNDVQRVDWTLPEASVILILRLPISDYKQQLISTAVDYKELCQRMFQLALGHVVLWLPCFVQVCVALLFTATPYTIIVTFLWLSIISSDIVFDFEVEAYKYKAVAQLIKNITCGLLNSQFLTYDSAVR